MKLAFLDRLSKSTPISNFMKIRPLGADTSHVDGRTDMTKLIVAFRNSAKAPKNVKFAPFQGMIAQRGGGLDVYL